MIRHYKIVVQGKVQGVFYRASTKEEALRLGIKGIVKNQPDGSVYIEAEGTVVKLEKLVSWCWQGASRSDVTQVYFEEGALKNYDKFEVIH